MGWPAVARLRVVATEPDRVSVDDVERLTIWRNRHVGSFLTEFEATAARTADWLVNRVREDDGRILFMVESAAGQVIGYMGLAFIDWGSGRGEADAVVRGVDGHPGVMGRCLQSMLGWARAGLGLGEIWVRVRSDNPALGFYGRMGFVERHREPLVRTEGAGGVVWVSAPAGGAGGVALVHMEWTGGSRSEQRSSA